jgi:hypothetical protein
VSDEGQYDCKTLSSGKKLTLPEKEAPANIRASSSGKTGLIY